MIVPLTIGLAGSFAERLAGIVPVDYWRHLGGLEALLPTATGRYASTTPVS